MRSIYLHSFRKLTLSFVYTVDTGTFHSSLYAFLFLFVVHVVAFSCGSVDVRPRYSSDSSGTYRSALSRQSQRSVAVAHGNLRDVFVPSRAYHQRLVFVSMYGDPNVAALDLAMISR